MFQDNWVCEMIQHGTSIITCLKSVFIIHLQNNCHNWNSLVNPIVILQYFNNMKIFFKQAIQQKLMRDNHLDYNLEEIIVSSGGKHSLYNACQALFQSGDEVIIFSPYFFLHTQMY